MCFGDLWDPDLIGQSVAEMVAMKNPRWRM
jgi:hypothetical protein